MTGAPVALDARSVSSMPSTRSSLGVHNDEERRMTQRLSGDAWTKVPSEADLGQ